MAALKTAYKQLLPLILSVALGSALCLALNAWDNKYTSEGTQPMEGLMVLSEEELAQNPVHFLIHGWAFYPDVLLTPEALAGNEEQYYMVYTSIGARTRFDLMGGNDPHGCGTYALTIRLPDTLADYALELPEIYSAYKLYLNGRLVMQMGDPAPDSYRPSIQNRIVHFEGSGTVTILLAVSDRSHFYSGLVYAPAFGDPLALDHIRGIRLGLALCVFLLGILGALFACRFGINVKHRNALLFALLCFTASLFTSYVILHTALALPPQPWYALEIFSGHLMVTLVVFLQNRLCHAGKWLNRLSVSAGGAFCLLALCYGLCAPHLTVPVMKLFSALSAAFKLGAAFYLLGISLWAIHRRIPQTVSLYCASAFYAAVLIWDRILPAFEPIVSGWFSEWGSLVMILAIGYTLWRDVVDAYSSNLALAEEHRQMERQMAMQVEYARQTAERSAENRKLIHDFRQHLRTIAEMASQIHSQPETIPLQQNLLRYLEDLPQVVLQGTGISPGSFCNRPPVDALLQYYHTAASRQGISVRLAFHIPDGVPLSDVEWCSVLGNLLENAMEGCRCQEEGQRVLSISVRPMQGMLFLLVENSYDGRYRHQGGQFLSRKSGGVHYGVGLESVRGTVTRYGGTLDIYPLETRFRVGITLPVDLG